LWSLPRFPSQPKCLTLQLEGKEMNKLAVAALALLVVAAMGLPAEACHRKKCCAEECCAESCAPTTVAWVDKVVTCYKTEWRERDVTYTVQRAHYHDVVENHKCTVMVPVWAEQKQTVWQCNMVAREIV